MIVFPNAKINLGLHITSKRQDGYHEIESCMYPIPLYDALEIQIAQRTHFTSTGISIPGKPADNLILKAYDLLKKDFGELPSVSIHLHKAIPIGAGLGGGSADAAFALTLMNNLFELHLDDLTLEDYATKLGSDCPFFVQNKPKLVSGRGEMMITTTMSLKGKWILLINPAIQISTQQAYAAVTPRPAMHVLAEMLKQPLTWKEKLVNDFEKSLFPKYPQLATIKEQLYEAGAFYAAMSGSGSTMFGLFDEEPRYQKWNESYFVFSREL